MFYYIGFWGASFLVFFLPALLILKIKDSKKAASEEQRKQLAKERKQLAAIIGVIGIVITTVLDKVLS